ncbi:hypothetical protein H5410_017022 [Solanum commersonii]|uniref:Uncharacterized protein n=1 Tax=Solanum commersonii TaxID=4109 RepID=A0A9J5ZXY0_SOLCO|nr:hypothetical protein H5410_017022 [Solanum commersonii]
MTRTDPTRPEPTRFFCFLPLYFFFPLKRQVLDVFLEVVFMKKPVALEGFWKLTASWNKDPCGSAPPRIRA